jgi:hypothetical protein
MIKVTQFEPKTLRWWYSQRAKIDMNPSYQRHGRLWSETDKAFLVDSIINEYDVPKIYIADFTFGHTRLNSAGLPYAIIDGKQRLEALFDFFEGSLVLEDDFVCQQAPGLKLGGLGYSDLKSQYPDVADIVDNYPLSVMRVITDDEESINELFVRLNRSKPLTGAEIRNAMTGPVPGIIRYLVEHDVFQSCIRFPVRRGQDKNAAAKLLLFEFENKLAETKRRNLDQFTRGARRSPKDRLELASRRVIDTLDRMAGIFLPRDALLTSAGQFPVYYWFVRTRKPEADGMIREFLLQFERRRKQDRAGSPGTGSGKRPDRELLEYDAFNRSTNDIASHSGRFRILERRFARYKGTPKK